MRGESNGDEGCLQAQDLESWLRRTHVSLRPGQHTSLAYYVDMGSIAINAALRNGEAGPAGSTLRHVTLLDEAVGNQPPLPRCAIVWRGIRTVAVADSLRAAGVGGIFVEPAFTSASTSRDIGAFFANPLLLTIEIPASVPVLFVPATGVKSEEREVFLPRGLVYEVRQIADNEIEVCAHEPDE